MILPWNILQRMWFMKSLCLVEMCLLSSARKPIYCWYYTQAVQVAVSLRSFCSKCPFPSYHSPALTNEVPDPFPFPGYWASMKGHQIRKFQISPGVCFLSLLLCQCAEHVSEEAQSCLFSNRASSRNFILQLAVMHSYHPKTKEAKEYTEGVQELLGQCGCIAKVNVSRTTKQKKYRKRNFTLKTCILVNINKIQRNKSSNL